MSTWRQNSRGHVRKSVWVIVPQDVDTSARGRARKKQKIVKETWEQARSRRTIGMSVQLRVALSETALELCGEEGSVLLTGYYAEMKALSCSRTL